VPATGNDDGARPRALTERAHEEGTVRKVERPSGTPAPAGPTFGEWTEAWCADREQRGLASVKDNRGKLKLWVLPRLDPPLGKRPMASIQ
jgi:hypothetical protein